MLGSDPDSVTCLQIQVNNSSEPEWTHLRDEEVPAEDNGKEPQASSASFSVFPVGQLCEILQPLPRSARVSLLKGTLEDDFLR